MRKRIINYKSEILSLNDNDDIPNGNMRFSVGKPIRNWYMREWAGVDTETGKPLFDAKENFSGFWLIEAANVDVAKELAFAGSKACNRRVELRPLL